MNDDDFVSAGFDRLDPSLLSDKPPKIQWGLLYKETMSDERKIVYLEKLAASMNHAASLIQTERDKLAELCGLKEEQLTKMAGAVQANNDMLQFEVTRMNEQRQFFNAEVMRLNTEIRELKNGDNSG